MAQNIARFRGRPSWLMMLLRRPGFFASRHYYGHPFGGGGGGFGARGGFCPPGRRFYDDMDMLPRWARRRLLPFAEEHFRRLGEFVEDPAFPPRPCWWRRPVSGAAEGKTGSVSVKHNEKEFEIRLNVSDYPPEVLNVKLVNNELVISASQTQTPDEYGYISREFQRRFLIPEDVKSDTLESTLTDDGDLVIRAEIEADDTSSNQRVIDIKKSGGAS